MLCFTDVNTAFRFFTQQPSTWLSHIRSVRLSLRLKHKLDKYWDSRKHIKYSNDFYVTGDDVLDKSEWEWLFIRPKELPGLKDIRPYLAYDTGKRQGSVHEQAALARLRGWG